MTTFDDPDVPLPFAVANLAQTVRDLLSDPAFAWSDDLDERLRVVTACRQLVDAAKELENYASVDAIAVCPKEYPTEGGTWNVRSGSRRVIRDHSSVMSQLAFGITDSWVDDELTTELIDAVHHCLPASVGWKVTELRLRGLDPDDFSTWERGTAKLVFTPTPQAEKTVADWEAAHGD